MQSNTNPEELLFFNLEGKREQLQDIIDGGLDGYYQERVPQLIKLLDSDNAYYQLLACVVLVSWGKLEGFQRLINWASTLAVPWGNTPVVYDRLSNSDSAFEMLADAVKTSFFVEEQRALRQLQTDAQRALLNIYHQYYFGRTLALSLTKSQDISMKLKPEIIAAIEAGIYSVKSCANSNFDLAFQTSCLLIPLAPLDDHATASYANQLIDMYPENQRIIRELVNALGDGKGAETLACLQQIKSKKIAKLDVDVENSIARRSN